MRASHPSSSSAGTSWKALTLTAQVFAHLLHRQRMSPMSTTEALSPLSRLGPRIIEVHRKRTCASRRPLPDRPRQSHSCGRRGRCRSLDRSSGSCLGIDTLDASISSIVDIHVSISRRTGDGHVPVSKHWIMIATTHSCASYYEPGNCQQARTSTSYQHPVASVH